MRRSDVLLKVHQKNNTERRENKEVPEFTSIIESQIERLKEEIANFERLNGVTKMNRKAQQTADFFRNATAEDIMEFANQMTGETFSYRGSFLTKQNKECKVYMGDEAGQISITSINPNDRVTEIFISSAGLRIDIDLENVQEGDEMDINCHSAQTTAPNKENKMKATNELTKTRRNFKGIEKSLSAYYNADWVSLSQGLYFSGRKEHFNEYSAFGKDNKIIAKGRINVKQTPRGLKIIRLVDQTDPNNEFMIIRDGVVSCH